MSNVTENYADLTSDAVNSQVEEEKEKKEDSLGLIIYGNL